MEYLFWTHWGKIGEETVSLLPRLNIKGIRIMKKKEGIEPPSIIPVQACTIKFYILSFIFRSYILYKYIFFLNLM